MAIADLIVSLQSNPYFGAGFGLVGLTAALAAARKSVLIAWSGFRRYAFVTCEVNSKDKSYHWILEWITRKSSRTQHVSMCTEFFEDEAGRISTRFAYIPSPGIHFFIYKGTIFRCERVREQMDALAGRPYELVTLTTFGRDKSIFNLIFEEARSIALAESANKTATYFPFGHEWRVFGQARTKRSLDSVILDAGIKEALVSDVERFLSSSDWYHERGIPFRRGYLLYGPPGSGKSSFVFALAGHLNYSISVLNLSDQSMTDDRLLHLINTAPKDSLILLEDIDCAITSHKADETTLNRWQGLSRVTYSGLLNTLDGVVDDTLTRPGRVDFKIFIGDASDHQLKKAFMRFFPCSSEIDGDRFVNHIRQSYPQPISMARIQAHFLAYRDDPKLALQSPIM
ncbi:Mitochondrial chaperone BCS1 [Sarcoptes scabiei]|uniref:Mitochondrial chaperone BCS1 n=1 Tax=Sarcoptes scabiei TaxID=52283 RepID=A0A834RH25_SARSC|nr:Mitochondrial chaperone BCS1 [Sarcoptes scabiei]